MGQFLTSPVSPSSHRTRIYKSFLCYFYLFFSFTERSISISPVAIYFTIDRHFCTGSEVIKLFSCSTELSMKFFLLINVKMPTIVGILTFMSRKNSILSLSEPEKC